jgi:hypothetical protein
MPLGSSEERKENRGVTTPENVSNAANGNTHPAALVPKETV